MQDSSQIRDAFDRYHDRKFIDGFYVIHFIDLYSALAKYGQCFDISSYGTGYVDS